MHNHKIKFQKLLEQTSFVLGKSEEKIKQNFKDDCIRICDSIEKDLEEHIIEIRFNDKGVTLSLSFDNTNCCTGSYIFFDSYEDENLLIAHLVETSKYSYRKSLFKLPLCFLKINETRGNLTFHLYK